MRLAWWSASAGIVLGLVRAGWTLWNTDAGSPTTNLRDAPLLLVLGFLLVCLWIALRPEMITELLSKLLGDVLPLFEAQ